MNESEAGKFQGLIKPHRGGATLCTVGGETVAQPEVDLYVPKLRHSSTALVLPNTPSLLSIGQRCRELGFSFEWPAYSSCPILTRSKGKIVP